MTPAHQSTSILAVAVLILFISFQFVYAAVQPGTGCRTATAQDVANGSPPGSTVCANDRAIQGAGDFKQYLVSKLTGAAKARGEKSVTNMVPTFACRLASFFKAADAAGYNIQIFSGWRGVDVQNASAAKARAGGRANMACQNGASCPHPQGRAADLLMNGVQYKTKSSCAASAACRWAHENAAKHGLVFPLMTRTIEPWHIEPKERSAVPKGVNCAGISGPGSSTSAPSSSFADALRSAISGIGGGGQGGTSAANTQKCQQMAEQCKAGNSGACTAYPYECQGQQQPPSGGAPSGPSGSAPSAGSNPGTSGVTSAYQPPTTATAPTTVVSTTVATSTTTATSTDVIQDTLTTLTVSNQATTTPKNPLDPTTVIRLAQERTTLQPEAPVTGLPPTIVSAPQQFTTPGDSTFGEGKFTNTPNESLETHALPTGGTFASGTFGATLSQIKTVLESILAYLQPFSPVRYALPVGEDPLEPSHDHNEEEYGADEWTAEDAAELFGDEGAAALFDDGFEFPRFNQ